MQVIQKVAHEFMGILLLIAPETNRNSVMGEAPPAQPNPQEGKAWGGDIALRSELRHREAPGDFSSPYALCFTHKISQQEK